MNNPDFPFTFKNIEKQYIKAIEKGYKFITCEDYFKNKDNLTDLTVVNRIDIDLSVKKTEILRNIYKKLNIKGTFFIRLHAKEYNPFSFENFRIINLLKEDGHELGYHSEIIDQSSIWNIDPEVCLRKDIEVFNRMFDVNIKGIASHNGSTILNNLDFWVKNRPSKYGILYEAYDEDTFNLFNNSFYISDSEWTRWKAYKNGKLLINDRRSFGEHLEDLHKLIYLLIHPDTYYENHIYE